MTPTTEQLRAGAAALLEMKETRSLAVDPQAFALACWQAMMLPPREHVPDAPSDHL